MLLKLRLKPNFNKYHKYQRLAKVTLVDPSHTTASQSASKLKSWLQIQKLALTVIYRYYGFMYCIHRTDNSSEYLAPITMSQYCIILNTWIC